ncbi:MAG: CopG family transcriptional regulator [Archaeoglobus sp.]|nr:CopG family transcriptional regulator [Archaeoglobus sp.]
MSKVLGIRLDKETFNLLEEKAKKEGKNKSKILKELVVNYLGESGSGSKPSQNNTKVGGFVEKKPVNTSHDHDESHTKMVKVSQPEPPKAEHTTKSHFQPEKDKDEPKLNRQIEQLTQGDANFSQKHGKNQSKANLFRVFVALGLIFGLAAIGYFAYKTYVNRPKEKEFVFKEPDYSPSPQALSYISK